MSNITTGYIESASTLSNPLVMRIITVIRNANNRCQKDKFILFDTLALNFFSLLRKEGYG
jgi:hypothetical protein